MRILGDLDYVAVYVDDIVIFSMSFEEHIDHVKEVIDRLTKSNLIINKEKSHFLCTQVVLLGFVVQTARVREIVVPDYVVVNHITACQDQLSVITRTSSSDVTAPPQMTSRMILSTPPPAPSNSAERSGVDASDDDRGGDPGVGDGLHDRERHRWRVLLREVHGQRREPATDGDQRCLRSEHGAEAQGGEGGQHQGGVGLSRALASHGLILRSIAKQCVSKDGAALDPSRRARARSSG